MIVEEELTSAWFVWKRLHGSCQTIEEDKLFISTLFLLKYGELLKADTKWSLIESNPFLFTEKNRPIDPTHTVLGA